MGSQQGTRYRLPPHAVMNPPPAAAVGRHELFGPVLVVRDQHEGLSRASADAEVVANWVSAVNGEEEPLACYVFTDSRATKEYCAQHVRCGGMTFNQVNKHSVVANLPFGGMGKSGMGCYHGPEGFRNFSHRCPVYDFKQVGVLGFSG